MIQQIFWQLFGSFCTQFLDAFSAADKANRLRLVVSRDGRDGSVSIHRDADIHAGLLESGVRLTHTFAPGRLGWLQVVRGTLSANGLSLQTGDGMSLRDTPSLELQTASETEVLLFDMG